MAEKGILENQVERVFAGAGRGMYLQFGMIKGEAVDVDIRLGGDFIAGRKYGTTP